MRPLFEAIGLRPVLVFKVGHAFIAWRPSRSDKTKLPYFFLETTMTGGPATFEQAVETAMQEHAETAAENQFDLGLGALVDISVMRRLGYSPQPY